MRRLLKFMNYAAQLMALIDIGRTIHQRDGSFDVNILLFILVLG